MKKLTTASLLALSLIASTGFAVSANEKLDIVKLIQKADEASLETVIANLIAANPSDQNILQEIANASDAAGVIKDDFITIALANGVDATLVGIITESYTAAGQNNNGVGRGVGAGRNINRGMGNGNGNGGNGGGGGGGGTSEDNNN